MLWSSSIRTRISIRTRRRRRRWPISSGYHYYTELAHSAGMPKERIEEPGLDPREKVRRLVERLAPLENTIQYSWLVEIAQRFFGFRDERVTPENWESLVRHGGCEDGLARLVAAGARGRAGCRPSS